MTDDRTKIWDTLAKTDPAHTKGFSRSGGFKGTAIKPIWILRQLTEQFGAAGVGWGVHEPKFEVVPADGEILVYCTVSAWHGSPDKRLWGVGGDKVQSKRSSGVFCDDEAFKKAFTDAVGNAFKSIGIGADVHMGLFDDDKYVTAMKAEFAEPAPAPAAINDEQWSILVTMIGEAKMDVKVVCDSYGIDSLKDLPASRFAALKKRLDQVIQDIGKVAA